MREGTAEGAEILSNGQRLRSVLRLQPFLRTVLEDSGEVANPRSHAEDGSSMVIGAIRYGSRLVKDLVVQPSAGVVVEATGTVADAAGRAAVPRRTWNPPRTSLW